MSDLDDLMQKQLEALKNGTDLETLLEQIPEEDEEIASLLRLAVAVRNIPHPRLGSEAIAKQKEMLTKETSLQARSPVGIVGKNGRERREEKHMNAESQKRSSSTQRWTFLPIAVGLAVLCLMAFGTLMGAGAWLMFGASKAQAATVMDVQGQVEVAQADGTTWKILADGEKLRSGERIRTGAASQATLVFYDGSRTTLGANADLVLTRVNSSLGKVVHVVLTQNAGKTSYSVVPFRGKGSLFMVFTPSGAASVHGTSFNVAVNSRGQSRFAVDMGKVLVTNQTSEMFLGAGQAVSFTSNEPLDAPAYQFSLEGTLSEKGDTIWAIQGVKFLVIPETYREGDPQVGDSVEVDGRILENGEWVADEVTLTDQNEFEGSFTGAIQTMGAETWQIGGHEVQVNGETKLDEGLQQGDLVRVKFTLMEGGLWLALKIERLENNGDATPTPTATPNPGADPFLEFKPDHLEANGCLPNFSFTGGLANTAGEPDDIAAGVLLGYQVTEGAKFVNSVMLIPQGWDTILPGEQKSFDIQVALDPEAWKTVPAGTKVELRVFVAEENNNPEGHEARLTVTITAGCEVTPTVTPEPTDHGDIYCTGANPHPTGEKLAERFGVPYEEIMGWFCQHFGFGEIDRAYSFSLQYDVAVEDIFALRTAGMGWGQIRKLLESGWTPTPDTSETPSPTPEPSETPSPTPGPSWTPSPSPEPSGTPEPSETPEPPGGETDCTGANPHPIGQRLADRYGVPYEEIMGWFCQGFGFGEIDWGYRLGLQYGKTPAEIFDLRRAGMGWGEIKKYLAGAPDDTPVPTPSPTKEHGKPPDKGKKW